MFRKQQICYQDPQLIDPIYDIHLKFERYLAKCKEIITQHRHDLAHHADRIIYANTPFEIYPQRTPNRKRIGALLIHGLFDSPFSLREIGEKLASEGMHVRSILLPGHGTVPGALLHIKLEDWLQAVHYGIASFNNEVDQLFLVGYSTGGSLAYYCSQQITSDFISGLILLAPAFQIKSRFAWMTPWLCRYPTITQRAMWLTIQEEMDYVKYQSMATQAVAQTYRLTQLLRQCSLPQKEIPQLLVVTEHDKTVSSQAMLQHFAKHTSPKNRLILYANHHPVPDDERITVRPAAYPQYHILDIAHNAIPFSPNNSHYGQQGDYPFASRAEKNSLYLYDEINLMEKALYDRLYKMKLTSHLRRRLTYNPDFDYLMQSIIDFVRRCKDTFMTA